MCQNFPSFRDAWLAPLVECVTLDLGVVSLSPMLGVEPTLKKMHGDDLYHFQDKDSSEYK